VAQPSCFYGFNCFIVSIICQAQNTID